LATLTFAPRFDEQLDQRQVGHSDRLGQRAGAVTVDDVGAFRNHRQRHTSISGLDPIRQNTLGMDGRSQRERDD
jgi:hypothetical protein